MDRRAFLSAAGAGAALAGTAAAKGKAESKAPAAPAALVKPAALRPGDTVGVVALSSMIPDPDDYAKIEPTLAAFGLKAKIAPHVRYRSREIHAAVRERVSDLHDLFADPGVKGVFCARGGYGASEVLPHLDFAVIARNPKVFVGYSDTTVVHLAIRRQAGLLTFHGPMPVASAMTRYTEEAFRRAVFSTDPIGLTPYPDEANPIRPAYPRRTIVPGRAEGPIVGGNLSMVIALMGTPNEIDTRDSILFLEDVTEEPYRIGRMLYQLAQAGKFDHVRGVIMGRCWKCEPGDFLNPSFSSIYTLGEHIDNVLGDLKVPVLSGLALGHTPEQLTMPLGARVRLDADAQTLTVLESGVV
jgi:muramoyltetrapeptide carboxypeptidase